MTNDLADRPGERLPAGTLRTVELSPSCQLAFVWCPPGGGTVGTLSPDVPTIEQPSQPIRWTFGFWMARTPVTQTQWREIGGPPPRANEADDCPVAGITWDEARGLCSRLGDRLRLSGFIGTTEEADLPYEAEWEYACRAGTAERWYFGNDSSTLAAHAWYRNNGEGRIHPAGRLSANPWGLLDLYGNVAEWCRDAFRRYDESEVVDPRETDDGGLVKAVRGGDFASPAVECRSAARAFSHRNNPDDEPLGVRPVLRRL